MLRSFLLATLALGMALTGCARREEPSAREAGREAYRAGKKIEEGAKEVAREAKEAAREFREGWEEAQREDPKRRKK